MPEIDSGGVRIHYDDVGTGEPPLLLLHGGMASCQHWLLAGYADALAGDHRLVMPDFRGHGASSRPHDASMYGLPFDVADVLAVLDAAGVESAVSCGWSWGGTVGLALAALHPERVTSVLAIGSSGRHGRFSDLPADFSRFPGVLTRIATEGLHRMAEESARAGGQPWLRTALLRNDPAAMTAWLQGQLATPPLGRVLAGVRQPVRFIAGEHELPNLDFPQPLLPPQADLQIVPSENHVSAFLRTDVVVTAIRQLSTQTHATTLARRRRERWP